MTVIVQLPFDGIVPPVNRIPAEPTASAAPALLSNDPAQVFVVTRSATVMTPGAVGNVSVKVAAVKATELLLDKMICSVDTPETGRIGLVKKDLVIVGAARTVMSSVAAVPFEAAAGPVTVNPPTGIVLIFKPIVVPVIVAVTVHEPFAGIVPPVIETVEPLAALVPTQLPPGTDAVKPLGKVSVKAAPVMAVAVGLVSVIVSAEVPFNGINAAPNAFVILGRATFSVALVPVALVPMFDATAPAKMLLV